MRDDCWNSIGVEGDLSCPQLKTVIHCRNCSVYSMAGRSLLEREIPPGYLEEWTNIVARATAENSLVHVNEAIVPSEEALTLSVMVFCLGEEFLAIPVQILQEVTQTCVIQKLPHRSNDLFMGLVNIRGEILLCICLGHLLNLEGSGNPSTDKKLSISSHRSHGSQRMIVIADQEHKWVFPADQIAGIHRFRSNELQSTPVVISKAASAYTKGIINWEGRKVNFLDSDLLFYTLSRRIL